MQILLFKIKGISIVAYAIGIVGAILAFIGFLRILPTLITIPSQQIDFAAYYVAAARLNANLPLYESSKTHEIAELATIQHTGYIYPPFWAALLRPLALLSYRHAEIIWFIANIFLLATIALFLQRLLGLDARATRILGASMLLLPAVYDSLLLGQMSILLTALIMGSLHITYPTAADKKHDLLAGFLLGCAAALKVYPILLTCVYLLHKRWTVVLGIGSGLLFALTIGLVWGGGWESHWTWLSLILPNTAGMLPFPSNQSLRGVLARFLTTNSFQVPVLNKTNFVSVVLKPAIESPEILTLAIIIGNSAILFITLLVLMKGRSKKVVGWLGRFASEPSYHQDLCASSLDQLHQKPAQLYRLFLLDMAIMTTVMLLITPVVWDMYYVHLLFPLSLLLAHYHRSTEIQIACALVGLLLALERYWRYMLLYVQSPWLMLWGFLAVLLLWIILLRVQLSTGGTHMSPKTIP